MKTTSKGVAKARPAAKKTKPSTPAPDTPAIPRWLEIALDQEDVNAWERASWTTNMLMRAFGEDVLKRAVELPRDAQPEIYEMPNCPGRKEWPGNRLVLSIDAPLGRSIVRVAGELGVSVHDWAYSTIIAESLRFRETEVISPKKVPGEEPVVLRLPHMAGLRIAEADNLARELGLSHTVTGIVLGDLASHPENIGEIITENFPSLAEEDLVAVQQAVERWKAEDAGKGGAA